MLIRTVSWSSSVDTSSLERASLSSGPKLRMVVFLHTRGGFKAFGPGQFEEFNQILGLGRVAAAAHAKHGCVLSNESGHARHFALGALPFQIKRAIQVFQQALHLVEPA